MKAMGSIRCRFSFSLPVLLLILSVFHTSSVSTATTANHPPVFQVAPILQSSLTTDHWCNTPGVDDLASPLVRTGIYLLAGALLLSRLCSPSSQANIIIPLSAIITILCIQLLHNTQDARQSVIGEHPVALELFLVALPSWLGLLCTSPLHISTQVTNFNPGTTILSFLAQTVTVGILIFTQIFISIPRRRFLGMDLRKYEITRNRNSDMEQVYDGSTVEYAYQGENYCGRRATLASRDIHLDSNIWANFLIAWAAAAIAIWVIITLKWVRRIMGYFYFHRPQNTFDTYDTIEIADGLPALAQLQPLFRDGELPARPPMFSEAEKELGMAHAETGWGGWFRSKLNLQFVILDKPRRHCEIYFGLANPVNISYFVMMMRFVGFVLVVLSVEQTVGRWNIIFGRSMGEVGKDGDFSTSRGDWSGVRQANGVLVMVLAAWALVSVVCGFIGEKWYWRLVGKISEKVRSDKGLGRRLVTRDPLV